MKDQGNAVLGAVLNIAVASLCLVSVLAVILAGHQLLLVRSVAVDSARFAALAESSQSQSQKYALELLTKALPRLANYEIQVGGAGNFSEVKVRAKLPGSGMLSDLIPVTATARAKYEKFS